MSGSVNGPVRLSMVRSSGPWSSALLQPSVTQSLAAVRMLFYWLAVGQVMPTNPAAAVRGPAYAQLGAWPAFFVHCAADRAPARQPITLETAMIQRG